MSTVETVEPLAWYKHELPCFVPVETFTYNVILIINIIFPINFHLLLKKLHTIQSETTRYFLYVFNMKTPPIEKTVSIIRILATRNKIASITFSNVKNIYFLTIKSNVRCFPQTNESRLSESPIKKKGNGSSPLIFSRFTFASHLRQRFSIFHNGLVNSRLFNLGIFIRKGREKRLFF